jgi:SAM-dependent methyltransferase
MASTASVSASAQRHGTIWALRARDWAGIEEQQLPTYEEVIRRAGIRAGRRVLDIGCGTGVFLRAVADRGARPFGLDASDGLLAIARERVPEAELTAGDMEALPYADDTFDVVAGFNSFIFAPDIVRALGEARRVAKPGAPVVVQVWGPPERCDLTAMKRAIGRFVPAPPPAAPAPPPLWQPGVLEEFATQAGLTPVEAFDIRWAFEYADDAALARAMLAPGLVAEVVERAGEDAVAGAVVEALARYRTPGGGYRLANEWHALITHA